MFYFLHKTSFLNGRQAITAAQSCKPFHILQDKPSVFKLSNTLRFISTASNQHSFTVSYLINKCGLSPESASSASKYVHFETPEKPDTFIAFLEKHGFSKTQISNLIKRRPDLLVYDTEKTLLPKLEFLYSIGFSRPDVAKLLTIYPTLLRRSLEKKIIPSFNFLRNLFQSNDKTMKAIKRFTGILVYNFESYLFPNMNVLRRNGVPESNIVTMLYRHPRLFICDLARFKEIVEEIKRMGIDSSRPKFVEAAIALRTMSKSTLEKKFDVCRRWGWSDQEIFEAFQKYPSCMKVSEVKIMAIMDFLVNKMGFNSTLVAKQSCILSRSLEKRIVPRALFVQELSSQGFINDLKLSVLFATSEKEFLRIFVYRDVNKAPELLKLYEEKLNISRKKNENFVIAVLITIILPPSRGRVGNKMRLYPSRFTLLLLVSGLRTNSKSTWERKFNIYNKCGWIDEESFPAFRSCPLYLTASEKTFMAIIYSFKKMELASHSRVTISCSKVTVDS
ncbi:transcription termination factor MTERF15, mitochondrial-like [Durio zibethinus]|uniref:Transcription termination factor MTERF15, mitochondrial-like n=1 Tax=Durio zibethinus TaxID=66656 RepID=A0A6P6A746_DURZI|nr:transcription termination factor MTERF15, mitochondrial-like [Durio zibethinus]